MNADEAELLSAQHSELGALQRQKSRLREAMANIGPLLTTARQADPLPALRDQLCDILYAESLEIRVPAPARTDEQSGVLYSPIMIGRRTIGMIEARRGREFDPDECALARVLGQIVGAILEYSSLQSQFEQYRSQVQANTDTLDRLLDFGRLVVSGTNDLLQLGLKLATQVPNMVGGERASLLLTPVENPNAPILILSTGIVASTERAQAVRDHGFAGLVLRERRPLIIDETDTDQRWLSLRFRENDAPTRCAMAVPLLWGDRILGALTVTTTQTHLFDTPQLNLLELVACHISLALHAVSLGTRLRRQYEVLNRAADELEQARAIIRATYVGGQTSPATTIALETALSHLDSLAQRLAEARIALHSASPAEVPVSQV